MKESTKVGIRILLRKMVLIVTANREPVRIDRYFFFIEYIFLKLVGDCNHPFNI